MIFYLLSYTVLEDKQVTADVYVNHRLMRGIMHIKWQKNICACSTKSILSTLKPTLCNIGFKEMLVRTPGHGSQRTGLPRSQGKKRDMSWNEGSDSEMYFKETWTGATLICMSGNHWQPIHVKTEHLWWIPTIRHRINSASQQYMWV